MVNFLFDGFIIIIYVVFINVIVEVDDGVEIGCVCDFVVYMKVVEWIV